MLSSAAPARTRAFRLPRNRVPPPVHHQRQPGKRGRPRGPPPQAVAAARSLPHAEHKKRAIEHDQQEQVGFGVRGPRCKAVSPLFPQPNLSTIPVNANKNPPPARTCVQLMTNDRVIPLDDLPRGSTELPPRASDLCNRCFPVPSHDCPRTCTGAGRSILISSRATGR